MPNQFLQIKQTMFSTELLHLMAIIIFSAICGRLKPTTENVVYLPFIGLPCVLKRPPPTGNLQTKSIMLAS